MEPTDPRRMHVLTPAMADLARATVDYALHRVQLDPPPLDGPRSQAELRAAAGRTITPEGLGWNEALRVFLEELAPATISIDHPRFAAFVPAAPTEASILFDLVVSASSIFGGTWLEGAGAVFAENEALAWLAGLAGLPEGAGGVFVSGGTAANLSGLVTARHASERRRGGRPARWMLAASAHAHSSITAVARVMDVDVLRIPEDEQGRLTGEHLRAALDAAGPGERDRLFAVVATAGATNTGIVDDLAGVAEVARAHGLWLHVDGAYGGAALAAPSARGLFRGVEAADSFVVDPHKWLFAPFDCAALLYARPLEAARAHMQEAEYLDDVNVLDTWSPAHYAVHLSRRPRGLPFWFSLATHGTDAYRDAVESVLALAREAAHEIRRRPQLELLVEPELSVLLFRRAGWVAADYAAWSDRLLADQVAFVLPTSWRGERVARFCFVNPRTTIEDVRAILDTMG